MTGPEQNQDLKFFYKNGKQKVDCWKEAEFSIIFCTKVSSFALSVMRSRTTVVYKHKVRDRWR